MPKDNIFDGIVTSWKRVRGGEEIENILSKVEENFDFKNPSASLPDLIKAYQLIQKLEDRHWKTIKTDRKSTRLNSSHVSISYAVFCLKKKKLTQQNHSQAFT